MRVYALIFVGYLSCLVAACGGGGGDSSDNTTAPPAGNISGLVIDLDGHPVAGAQVSLATVSATTDANGRFALNAPLPGWLTVRHPQYLPRTRAAFPDRQILIRLTPDDGETITLHFGGDMMFGRRYYDPNNDGDTSDGLIHVGNEAHDQAQLLRYVQPLLASAEVTAVNLESPLSSTPYFNPAQPRPSAFHPTKDYVFASHVSVPQTLRDAGIDVVDLGNNHMYDLLGAGIAETRLTLDGSGYPTSAGQFGAGNNESEAWQPAFFTSGNTTIAFIGCTTITGFDQPISYVAAGAAKGGAARCVEKTLRDSIQNARTRAQVVVVMLHGGIEYGRLPSPVIQNFTAIAREAGATLVINHHPHVVGGLNWQDGVLTAWTLGNLLFDQDVWPTFESYLLAVHVRRGQVVRAYAEPLIIADYIPRPVVGAMADYVARGAAGRATGPFLMEDGVAEVDIGNRAIPQQTVVALDGDLNTGTIYHLENGAWLEAGQGSATILLGRDLLWSGAFEDETADDQNDPGQLWNLTGEDRLVGPDYAYEGRAGVRLRRLFTDSSDLVLAPQHRILIRPNQKLSVIGRVRTNGKVSLQLSWYPNTSGGSTLQTIVSDLVAPTNTWQPFHVEVTSPNFPEVDDTENQAPLKPSISPFFRLSPPGRDRATADFDNIRLIVWETPNGDTPNRQYDYLRLTGALSATLRRDVLPGAEYWTPPPTAKIVP